MHNREFDEKNISKPLGKQEKNIVLRICGLVK